MSDSDDSEAREALAEAALAGQQQEQEQEQEEQAAEQNQDEADNEPFALNPAQATGGELLKFSRKAHRAHYDAAVRSLYAEASDRYDLTQDKLHDFLGKVKRRAQQFSLSTIEVPVKLDVPTGDTVNLATDYGVVPESHLQDYASTYMGQQQRAAQDDHMLAQMILNSCSEDAQAELADHEEDYTIGTTPCGALLLSVVMREASVEVTTDPDMVRQELTNTHLKFKELGYDIEALHKWVNRKVKQLRASGEHSSDLRTHLFKAYRSSNDKEFKTYISGLKDSLRDTGTTLTAKQLMAKAKLKMKDLQRERALDEANGSSEDPILALQTRLTALENKRPSNRNKRKEGRGTQDNDRRGKTRRAGKGKNKSVPFPKELKNADAPADSKVPKKIDGVKYFSCDHHKKWGKHPTSDCKAKKALQQSGSQGGDQNQSRLARAARAIAAVATGGNDSE